MKTKKELTVQLTNYEAQIQKMIEAAVAPLKQEISELKLEISKLKNMDQTETKQESPLSYSDIVQKSVKLMVEDSIEGLKKKIPASVKQDIMCKGAAVTSRSKKTVITVPLEHSEGIQDQLKALKIENNLEKSRDPAVTAIVPLSISNEEFDQSIIEDNPLVFANKNDLISKPFHFESRNHQNRRVAFRVSGVALQKLASHNMKLVIGFERVRVYIDLKPRRCSHCLKFGHSKSICEKAKQPRTCARCGEQHRTAECQKAIKCGVCSGSKLCKETAHHTFDGNCPMLKIFIDRNIRNTHFVGEEVIELVNRERAILLNRKYQQD